MNTKELRKQLTKIGVNKAQADAGTSNGYPCIFVRWNGKETTFTGFNEMDPEAEEITIEQLWNFLDKNLDS